MSGPMIDLARVFDGSFYFPWNGVTWCVPEPPAAVGEQIREMVLSPELTPDAEIEMIQQLFGHTPGADDYDPADDVWLDLVNAGIGWCSLMHAGRTALIYFSSMPEAAEAHWSMSQLGKLFVDTADLEAAGEVSAP